MHDPGRDELEAMMSAVEAREAALRQARRRSSSEAMRARLEAALNSAAGFDELREATERLRRERATEMENAAARSREIARETVAGAAEALGSLSEARRVLIDDRAPEATEAAPWTPSEPPIFFIRSTPGGSVHDYNTASGVSWAKWSAAHEGAGLAHPERLSFNYVWQNTAQRRVLVDVTVGLTLKGHISAEASGAGFPGGLFFPDTRGEVNVRTEVRIWPLWLPQTFIPGSSVQVEQISANADVLDDSADTAVATNTEAQAIRVAVPRQAYIMIEAAVVADFDCTLSSSAAVDFASADAYRVDYPYCFVVRSKSGSHDGDPALHCEVGAELAVDERADLVRDPDALVLERRRRVHRNGNAHGHPTAERLGIDRHRMEHDP